MSAIEWLQANVFLDVLQGAQQVLRSACKTGALHWKQFEGARGARKLLRGAVLQTCLGLSAGVEALESRLQAADVRLESCQLAARKLLDPAADKLRLGKSLAS